MDAEIDIKIDKNRVRPDNSEVERLFCDNQILDKTNWQAAHDLDEGLIKTIEWIKNNLDLYKTDIYNV